MTNQTKRIFCPNLALHGDRGAVAAVPTKLHVCHLCQPLRIPSEEHQRRFCLSGEHATCSVYQQGVTRDNQPVQPTAHRSRHSSGRSVSSALWFTLLLVSAVIVIFTVQLQLSSPDIRQPDADRIATSTALHLVQPAAAEEVSTPLDRPEIANPSPTATELLVTYVEQVSPAATERFLTPTPVPGGQVLTIKPHQGETGWWLEESRDRYIGDSFLYAGSFDGKSYIAAMRFDLSRVPRGAPIAQATLRLTGLQDSRLMTDAGAGWLVQLLAESTVDNLAAANFLTIYSAPASITLLPELQPSNLAAGQANSWTFDANVLRWLEQQRLDGATSIYVRILGTSQKENSLFAWDSGQGTESAGNAPMLVMNLHEPPPSPPPLPTRQVIVATLTPTPQNVMTVVALDSTATAEALAFGTRTPLAYQVVTPTSLPLNLATVQAAAAMMGLAPVLIHTPVPQNAATATSIAEYATAVALTTGTFTPVPTAFVTPFLVLPSPPAENVATAAARVVQATSVASSGAATPTPLPHNAVVAEYVYATPTSESAEALVARNQEYNARVVTTGTPTPLPWNAVVITTVPTPAPPTPTPVPLIIPEALLTPTPLPTPLEAAPTALPDTLRNKIIFLSDRGGTIQTYAMNPLSGESFLITQDWVHPLAIQQLPFSPTGQEKAIVVPADKAGDYQIDIYSLEYGDQHRVTALRQDFWSVMSYDPAWSPVGDLIAFTSNHTGHDEIYTIDTEGKILQQLTFNNWEWDKHPTWSPDGQQIVFFSNRESGRRQLWIMNADGSEARNLSNNPYNDWDPVWTR